MSKPIWGRSKEEIDEACRNYGSDGSFSEYGIGAHALVPTPRTSEVYDGTEISFDTPAQLAVEAAQAAETKALSQQAAAVAIENV